ncbi:Esterase YdiI [compost metagenome]
MPSTVISIEALNTVGNSCLPGLLGIEVLKGEYGIHENRLEVRPELLAPNGFLHGGTVVALADTACGYGTMLSLPEGATSFTTIELKTNFLGTAREGSVRCIAKLSHGGRTTQVWDAEVVDEASGKTIAMFRCTQLLLYPKA